MSLRFDQPEILLLALLCLPLAVLSWWWLGAMDRLRRAAIVLLRSALFLCLVGMLAGPRAVRRHDDLTIIGIVDASESVKRFAQLPAATAQERTSNLDALRRWLRVASAERRRDDRFGLVSFDGDARAVSVPVKGDYVDDNLDAGGAEGTNIGEAIRLALALFPADTGRRIVLISDGNETAGDALEAARRAGTGAEEAGGVPIDVVPLTYRIGGDVQVVRVESPPTAQPGQAVTVRVLLEATAPVSGLLTLRREGVAVDLNGRAPGTARAIAVPAGRSIQLARVVLGEQPINRFEAVFEADDPGADALADNNRAESFTATPSRGAVLVLDARPDVEANPLAGVLRRAGLPVTVEPPHRLGDDLLALQRYDLIVLDNVAAYELSMLQQQLLARYVHDLGGGLIMVGGERSFGAGGWNGTDVESVLPLELDPPKEMRLVTAALVLVLDKSGSMNQHVAGTRSTQQRVANEAAAMAIESLRSESMVGVVTFDFFAQVHVPLQRNDDPKRIADRVRGITSDGGTNLAPALQAAGNMLAGVEAQRKLVVCLSDGRSHAANLDRIVNAMAADGVSLTTIAVGDEADHETLRRLSELGGGEFYPVRNPRTLPRVLVDSVQVINKPLVKEIPFRPVAQPTGSKLAADLRAAPPLRGLIITSRRPDPKVVIEATDADGEPLLAHWQVGLGRAAAFTSDAGGEWSRQWLDWSGYEPFWAHLARTISRPPTSPETELLTTIEDGRLNVTLEAGNEAGFLDYLHVDGTVYGPDGDSAPLRLRQTGPGRYEASAPAPTAGNYIVALSPRRGERRLSPVIGGASRTTSAEFRRFESDEALLERIRRLTGGRRLDVADSEAAGLYSRSERTQSVAALPVWPSWLWLALGLLLADVAGRRLAWDAATLSRLWARALARVTPGRLRGREAAETLAALRGAGARQRPGGPPPHGGTPAPRETPRQPAESPAAPPGREPPQRAQVAAALDALLGRRPGEPERAGEQPDEAAAPPQKGEDAATGTEAGTEAQADAEDERETEAPDSSTSSLLAAKRRARRRFDGDARR